MDAALAQALARHPLPAAVVDLASFDHNAQVLARLSRGRPLRIATKSVRCQTLLRRAADALGDGFGGLMATSPREALHLAEHGWDDVLVAYPVARPADAAPLVELGRRGVRAPVVVDHPDHVALLGGAGAAAGLELPVILEVDAAWRPLGRIHLGVWRSPVRTPEAAVDLARLIARTDGVRLAGVMLYEAQVAGLPDRPGGLRGGVVRLVKARSRPLVARRRAAVVAALRQAGHPVVLVNGGGTGSLRSTARDPSITEVTAGSGFLAPHLFDAYDDLPLRPAAFAVLPLTRRPAPDRVTAHGGGYPASGAAGADRLPRVASPGLSPTATEGFGEVQTPLREARPGSAPLGGLVAVRHAKAGELFERFGTVLLWDGAELSPVATWRGEGLDLG
jgi:D-serine deaminase-like pyridoxal phosphate-dependent protein